MSGMRRRARGYALQVLYGMDLNTLGDLAALKERFNLGVEPESESYANSLIETVQREQATIDEVVQAASKNWRLERMGAVDRNILRLASAELLFFGDVPTRVIINEAIELAKRFGTGESAAFVNGILDRVAAQSRGAGT